MTQHQPKILIVDDDEILLRTCIRVLRPIKPQTAPNGVEALKLIGKQPFDVIVSDMFMPEMGGEELYNEVMGIDPSQAKRMVFMTGDAKPHKEFLRKFPFYLSKPFDKEDFLLVVEHVLSNE